MRRAFIHLAAIVTLCTWNTAAAIRGDEPSLTETIDRWIDERLDRERLQRAPAADDAVFLRRAICHDILELSARVLAILDGRRLRSSTRRRSALIGESW